MLKSADLRSESVWIAGVLFNVGADGVVMGATTEAIEAVRGVRGYVVIPEVPTVTALAEPVRQVQTVEPVAVPAPLLVEPAPVAVEVQDRRKPGPKPKHRK